MSCKQNGRSDGFCFFIGNFSAFLPDIFDGQSHQMHGTQGMLKTGMGGTRINKAGKTQLFDPPQSLHIGMFKQIKNKRGRNDDKPMNRIVDDFPFIDDSGMGEFL